MQGIKNPKLKEVLKRYRFVDVAEKAGNIAYWDQRTYMAKEEAGERAELIGYLEVLYHRELLRLAPAAKGIRAENRIEAGILKELRNQLEFEKRIPSSLLMKKAIIGSKGMEVWEIAKKKNDFKMFEPYLKQQIEIQMQFASHIGYKSHPYDAMLDYYEYGMRVKKVDALFDKLLPELNRIRLKTEMPSEHKLEKFVYKAKGMRELTKGIQKLLRISGGVMRTDRSAHPFAIPIGTNDIRVTTTRHTRDFRVGLDNQTHEFGHAIYGFQIDPRLRHTPADQSASYGIDESQSRLWENVIGHSFSFVKVIRPLIQKHLGINDSAEEIYRYLNVLKQGAVVRMSANELDYDLHIALRYEIEKGLVSGEMKVSELPEIWNEYMVKYIGIKPRNDREGVLQDMHWADGSIGYFPTYTLGNMISGMIWKKIGNLDELVEQKRFDHIRRWLAQNIHQYGSLYDPQVLLKKVFRQDYNSDDYVEYLRGKYLG